MPPIGVEKHCTYPELLCFVVYSGRIRSFQFTCMITIPFILYVSQSACLTLQTHPLPVKIRGVREICNRCGSDVEQVRDRCATGMGQMCNMQVRDRCATGVHECCMQSAVYGKWLRRDDGTGRRIGVPQRTPGSFSLSSSIPLLPSLVFSLRLHHSTLPLQQGTCTIMLFLCLTGFYDSPSHKTQAKVRDERLRESRNHREDEPTSTNTSERRGEPKVIREPR